MTVHKSLYYKNSKEKMNDYRKNYKLNLEKNINLIHVIFKTKYEKSLSMHYKSKNHLKNQEKNEISKSVLNDKNYNDE